jgi:hypothetical protein
MTDHKYKMPPLTAGGQDWHVRPQMAVSTYLRAKADDCLIHRCPAYRIETVPSRPNPVTMQWEPSDSDVHGHEMRYFNVARTTDGFSRALNDAYCMAASGRMLRVLLEIHERMSTPGAPLSPDSLMTDGDDTIMQAIESALDAALPDLDNLPF